MTTAPRYWNVFPRTPTGRDQKRTLNRAATCPLCTEPLGTDRALYCAYTGFTDHEYIAAHPACADEHTRQLTERLTGGISRMARALT